MYGRGSTHYVWKGEHSLCMEGGALIVYGRGSTLAYYYSWLFYTHCFVLEENYHIILPTKISPLSNKHPSLKSHPLKGF